MGVAAGARHMNPRPVAMPQSGLSARQFVVVAMTLLPGFHPCRATCILFPCPGFPGAHVGCNVRSGWRSFMKPGSTRKAEPTIVQFNLLILGASYGSLLGTK